MRDISVLLPEINDSALKKLDLREVSNTRFAIEQILNELGIPNEVIGIDTVQTARLATITEITELQTPENYTSPALLEKLIGLVVGHLLAIKETELALYPKIDLRTGEQTIRMFDGSLYNRQGETVEAHCGKLIRVGEKIYGKYSVVYRGTNKKYTAIHDLASGETSPWFQIPRDHELTEKELEKMTINMTIKNIASNEDGFE